MSCNLLANPSFESGALSPWTASASGVTQFVQSSSAYDGSYYLDLRTAIDNGGNSISQTLHGLDTSTTYTVGVQAQLPSETASSYCSVLVYMGANYTSQVASQEFIEGQGGTWKFVGGSYQPKLPTETLHILAYCDLEDPSYTGDMFLDAAVFETSGSCSTSKSKSKSKVRKRKGVNRRG